MYNLFIHQVLSEPLPELPATLDRFTGIANTSSTPIGREGGEWAGTHIVAGKGYVYTENSQMASIGAIFNSTYHTKLQNPWPCSSANCVVNYILLSAFQGIWSHLKATLRCIDI